MQRKSNYHLAAVSGRHGQPGTDFDFSQDSLWKNCEDAMGIKCIVFGEHCGDARRAFSAFMCVGFRQ